MSYNFSNIVQDPVGNQYLKFCYKSLVLYWLYPLLLVGIGILFISI